MSKTATITQIIKSELENQGYNEFVKDGRLIFFDEEEHSIQKIIRYDEDVDKIVTKTFFKGFTFQNEKTDHDFKKTFVNHFLDREIMYQTVEKFASQVIRLTLQYEKYIENAYQKYQELLTQEQWHEDEKNSKQDSTNTTDNRNLRSTLPQDDINMNVENTDMKYADENSIDKQQQKGNETGNEKGNSKDNQYNAETLRSLKDIFKDIFEIYDRYCFLHVW